MMAAGLPKANAFCEMHMEGNMKRFCCLLALAALIGCSESEKIISAPPDIPLDQLQAAPDTVQVEGQQLYLETFVWRDFMPISPPDGKPLVAVMYITSVDSARLPATISADAVWIVYGDQVWKSWIVDAANSVANGYRLAKIAREGPKWGPGVRVDVIVRVLDAGGHGHLLQAPDQLIGRTD